MCDVGYLLVVRSPALSPTSGYSANEPSRGYDYDQALSPG
jgi:hypothetical protein